MHDDGRVTFDLDPSDAADYAAEYDPAYTPMYDAAGRVYVPFDEVLEADVARINAALAQQPRVRTPH